MRVVLAAITPVMARIAELVQWWLRRNLDLSDRLRGASRTVGVA